MKYIVKILKIILKKKKQLRESMDQKALNRLGFILLGITQNYGYTIMLTAAFDLLTPKDEENTQTNTNLPVDLSHLAGNSTIQHKKVPFCNPTSTATILVADVLPALLVKLVYPLFLFNIKTSYKMLAVIAINIASLIITALAQIPVIIFTGVVLTSIASGLGDPTILSLTPQYHRVSLSGFGIGTGICGVVCALSYTIMKMFMSVEQVLLSALVMPVIMAIAYFYMIKPIEDEVDEETRPKLDTSKESIGSNNSIPKLDGQRDNSDPINLATEVEKEGCTETSSLIAIKDDTKQQDDQSLVELTRDEKIKIVPQILKYFFPLFAVYLFEYFINQGLYELIYYPEITSINHAAQYRWFQVTYQVGVLISRSSLEFFKVKQLWLMVVLQGLNAVFLTLDVFGKIHVPSFYLMIAIILYEGLLGGLCYVNAYYRALTELNPRYKSFAISVISNSDTSGITLAAIFALPVHDYICTKFHNS